MQKIEITVSSKTLYNKLKSISKIVSKKSTIPALDCFYFEVKDNLLKITASDSEGTISTTVEVHKIEGSGEFLLEHKLLMDGLKELPEEPIVITVDTEKFNTTFKHEHGTFSMAGMNADEFTIVKIDERETVPHYVIESNVLCNGIKTVLPYAADDHLRPTLSGVFIECVNYKLNIVASNANYMAINEVKNVEYNGLSLIISTKIAKILSDLSEGENTIDIGISEYILSAEFGEFKLTARLVDGRYPNYRSVIPDNNNKEVFVPKNEMLASLRRATIFANKESSLITVKAKHHSLVLTGRDIDFSTYAEEIIPCDYTDDSIEIGFKSGFLRQCLETIPTDELKLTMRDSLSAALIMPVDEAENNISLTLLIMPMAINV